MNTTLEPEIKYPDTVTHNGITYEVVVDDKKRYGTGKYMSALIEVDGNWYQKSNHWNENKVYPYEVVTEYEAFKRNCIKANVCMYAEQEFHHRTACHKTATGVSKDGCPCCAKHASKIIGHRWIGYIDGA